MNIWISMKVYLPFLILTLSPLLIGIAEKQKTSMETELRDPVFDDCLNEGSSVVTTKSSVFDFLTLTESHI